MQMALLASQEENEAMPDVHFFGFQLPPAASTSAGTVDIQNVDAQFCGV